MSLHIRIPGFRYALHLSVIKKGCIWSLPYRRHHTPLYLLPQITLDYGAHSFVTTLVRDRQECEGGWYESGRENLDAVTKGL